MARLHETVATRLFGRAADLKRAEEALEQARLVTITGTAGVGKTRLAREIARRRVEPCVFVDATEARGVEALCAVVARALGLGHRGPSDASIQALGEALAARGRALVLLDNFEHHVALAPATIAAWMDAAPDAVFLVTSRERLHVEGELPCDLRPLPIPAPSASPDEIARCEAVQLFVARARAARGGIEPGLEDHEAVAAIVRRLDGVPLAIELAAARADVLSPAQILARLSRPLDLLAAPARGLPPRSTTLRAAIACSWDLLGEEERRALVECSVFRGGFTLEAAEEVLCRGETAIVDLVQTLVRKSLLYAVAGSDSSRSIRLTMFESVRAFVAETAAPPPAAERRHTAYYLRLGEASGRALRSAKSPAPLATLAAEHENLVAVLERAERDALAGAEEGALVAARAICALGPAGWLGMPPEAWIPHLDAVLAALDRRPAGALTARVLLLRARAAKLAGGAGSAAADVGAALAILRREPDPVIEAEALLEAAILAQLHGHPAEAALARALALAEAHGEHALAATIAGHAGWSRFLARPFSAQEAFEGVGIGLRSAQAIGDRALEARHRAWLGVLHGCIGRLGAGRSELAAALRIARELGDRALQAECLVTESLLCLDGGDVAAARAACDEARAVTGAHTARRERGAQLAQAGRIALASGRPDEAERSLRGAIEELDGTPEGTAARCLFAALLADRERPDDAAVELAAAAREDPEVAGDGAGLGRAAAVVGHLVASLGHDLVGPESRELGRAAAAVASAHLALARARAAEARGDLREAAAQRRSLEQALRAVRPWSAPPAPPSLRLAVRLLTTMAESAPAAREALLLGPDAAWFRVSGGEIVGLERRRPLRLILAFLARERAARPGVAAPLSALLGAGWPDERLSRESAKNRVHVAISTLRKLGLRQMLMSRDDGWLLDPSIVVVQDTASARGRVPA